MGSGIPKVDIETIAEVHKLLNDLRGKKSLVHRMSEDTYDRIVKAEVKLSNVWFEAVSGRAM